MNPNLLIVDDDPLILELITGELEQFGYNMFTAGSGREAMSIFQTTPIHLALLDYSLPDVCGENLFRRLRAQKPDILVMFLTGNPNLETAVSLMKSGVNDYLTKPFSLKQLSAHVRAIFETNGAAREVIRHEYKPDPISWFPGGYSFGNSKAMREVDAQIRNLPRYPDTTVLLTGPTGTGKSVVARRIHELTWGNKAPFVEIDCSTIPRDLCESELFGHEKGSFTGALRSKQGLFEAAANGTAFLDEIGELDLSLQAKFLRVLEARQFKRVGCERTIPMSARVIAATNQSLPGLVREGRFREDLYFRLNVVELWMPPLRERREDMLILARQFLNYYARRYEKELTGFTVEAVDYLQNCDFPGNIRELRNMIERAVISTNTSLIQLADLVSLNRSEQRLQHPTDAPASGAPLTLSKTNGQTSAETGTLNLATLERQKLFEALASANGNKSKAATMVGLSRTAFHRRLQKYQQAQ